MTKSTGGGIGSRRDHDDEDDRSDVEKNTSKGDGSRGRKNCSKKPDSSSNNNSSRGAKDYPLQYLAASALAATINYPLWRASAISQSGFRLSGGGGAAAATAAGGRAAASATASGMLSLGGMSVAASSLPQSIAPYAHGFMPPYKGLAATVLGMTWARAAIFWGSDYGRSALSERRRRNEDGDGVRRVPEWVAAVLPPLVVSTSVQFVNMPLVRATITLQDPSNPKTRDIPDVASAVRYIYRNYGGVSGLWHGTSAGVLKTVPKYCTAVIVKDCVEDYYSHLDRQIIPSRNGPAGAGAEVNNLDSFLVRFVPDDPMYRSALKSAAAGVAGAALTNPLDVIRNEMFKTNLNLFDAVRKLRREDGGRGNLVFARGLSKNLIAVAVPVGCTIFFTDLFVQWSRGDRNGVRPGDANVVKSNSGPERPRSTSSSPLAVAASPTEESP